jgi:O-succinylbenzoate synthase
MMCTGFRLFTYRLPLTQPVTFGAVTVAERTGLVVRLESAEGHIGWGEAAPVPGFSIEGCDQVEVELIDCLHAVKGRPLGDTPVLLFGALAGSLKGTFVSPSVRFAVETALLQLLAADRGVRLAGLLNANAVDTLRVNGFVTGSPAEVIERARQLQRNGYRAIKVKVGRRDLEEDIATVKHVYHELDSRCGLRLDANRAWTLDQATEFLSAVAGLDIEYIEEPVQTAQCLRELMIRRQTARELTTPIALDETLREIEPGDLSRWLGVSAVILKPTLLGGIERTAAFAAAARKQRINAVLSSSFESSLGVAVLGQLAAACGTPGVPVGLDTIGWLSEDLLSEPLPTTGDRMTTARLARVGAMVIEARLTEVARG